jgi:ABC-type glycerol-3-phosphate transport system permease component
LWPSHFAFGNYVQLWSSQSLAQGLTNSIVVALSAAVASTLFAVGTAYCLVRFTFLGRAVILRSLVGLQALPGTMLILPLFVVFSSMQAYLGMQIVGTPGWSDRDLPDVRPSPCDVGHGDSPA